MRRILIVGALLAAGCSNAPLADLLDLTSPARFTPNANTGRGGVCNPAQIQPAPPPVGRPLPPGDQPPAPEPVVPR